MEDNLCKEFIVGCCPYEAFAAAPITKQCPSVHNQSHRDEYENSSNIYSFERQVYYTYKEIIDDVEKKIFYNQKCINDINNIPEITDALVHVEKLICTKGLASTETNNVYDLLRIHGRLVIEAQKKYKAPIYSVCKICSAIKEKDECAHAFCKSYSRIRSLLKKLETKLNLKED